MKKRILFAYHPLKTTLVVFFIFVPFFLFSQPGIAEFQTVRSDIVNTFKALKIALFAVSAIFGIVGGARVYVNWNIGKQNIDGQVIGWFCASLFFIIASIFIESLYGV